MIKKIAVILIIFAFLASAIIVTAEAPAVETPTVEATAAILMDAETGRVLWGKNHNQPMSMASTTKIMTAILAIESGKMDEIVTVSKRAATAPKVKMNLSAGEKIRLGDLMLALMLESSNDAAVAIAEHLGGTVEDFCASMTQKAKALGANNTIFETPSGLDAGNHHSTAYDLAIITRYALEVPGFITITNTQSASFASDKRGYAMNNKNRLLREFPGANGVKTGFTGKAGHCFVGAAKQKDMQLISVVLASGWGTKGREQKWRDTKEVLTYGFDNFQYETIIIAETQAGEMPITRSRCQSVDFIFSEGVKIPLNPEEKGAVSVQLFIPESMQAPVETGQVMGSARVYINEDLYCEVVLTSTEAATRHDFKASLEKVVNAFVQQMTNGPVEIILPEMGV